MSDELNFGEERPEDSSRKPRGKFLLGAYPKYVVTGLTAAAASVLIYAGIQYTQARTTAQSAVDALDNPLKAETKSVEGNGNGKSELRKTSESFRSVAKKVGPAVVNIKSTRGMKKPKMQLRGRRRNDPSPHDEEGPGGPSDDHFREFFERFGMPFPFHGMPEQGPQTSLGSGVIIDKGGYVVTNNHVVEGATEVMVSLAESKTEMKAKIIGTDSHSDLAVLKIEKGGDFPNAEFADSDTVEVGDWAVAIGSPFALGQSVTVGIVSAKGGRQGFGSNYSGDLLQTDAAINPGNSGGPLCDIDGKVMGINTAIYTRSGGYMGIGFAIPSNLVKDVAGKLIKDGKIVRGWLGVYIQPLDEELGKDLGVKQGVGIHEVIPDSPADKAGLRAGDVVIEIDGKEVKEVNALQRTIAGYKPGQTVKMKVVSYSEKKTRSVTVKIGTLPDKDQQDATGREGGGAPDKLGLVVSKGRDGVIVDTIQPGSVGDQVGLEVGDTIVRINRKSIDSVATYKKLMTSSKRVYLEVKRKGRTLFFQFSLPE